MKINFLKFKFQKINHAYSILSSRSKRNKYDYDMKIMVNEFHELLLGFRKIMMKNPKK